MILIVGIEMKACGINSGDKAFIAGAFAHGSKKLEAAIDRKRVGMRQATRIAMALALLISHPAYAGGKIVPDRRLTYKKIGGIELKLHIFNPEGHKPTDKRPAIVFFFGGGWMGGSPRQFYQQAESFAAHGVVAIPA